MMDEVSDHESRNHWSITKHCDLPPGKKTIMSIWSFKHKWYPDGTPLKHKARLCAHGGMQTWGQNYLETYAPVRNWTSIWIILAIAKTHGLSSKSIDFVLAFPQADLEIPVYIEIPVGFDAPDGENRKTSVLMRKCVHSPSGGSNSLAGNPTQLERERERYAEQFHPPVRRTYA